MFEAYYLSILIALSFSGGGVLLLFGTQNRLQWTRWFAFIVSLSCLAIGGLLLSQFDVTSPGLQFRENRVWMPYFHLHYALGVDGLALSLILLVLFITFLLVLNAWHHVYPYFAQYLGTIFLSQSIIIACFSATDALLFYICWEAMLIPIMLSIGIWGSHQSGRAAMKFFMYTLIGSSALLMALLYLGHLRMVNFDIQYLQRLSLTFKEQLFIFTAFFFAFAIKMPLWPFHTWLPETHTEAPTEISILLSAILLKLGGYGFLRFCLPIAPDASQFFAYSVCVLGLIAMLYAGFIALVQEDMKKLIAYASISHMGLLLLGIFLVFPLTTQFPHKKFLALLSLQAVNMQMLAHALSVTGLFSSIGILYTRFKSRKIKDYAGLATTLPTLSYFFLMFTCCTIGVPGTAGFVSDIFMMLAAIQVNLWWGIITAIVFFLGASYMFSLYISLFWGKATLPGEPTDVTTQRLLTTETLSFILLSVMILSLGVFPHMLFELTQPSLEQILMLSLKSKL